MVTKFQKHAPSLRTSNVGGNSAFEQNYRSPYIRFSRSDDDLQLVKEKSHKLQ